MKVGKVLLSLCIVFLLFSAIGQAASNKTILVSMNGANVSVTQVPIIMDGQVINTEFPSFVHTNRTLVPVRFVSEHYGAKVGWDQKTQTAIVTYGDKEGRFTLDSNIAIINGEKRILDKYAIPRLATFKNESPRTMIPLAFMTDIFGYEVGWNDSENAPFINSKKNTPPTNTNDEGSIKLIEGVSVEKTTKGNKIIIKSNSKLEYETLFLQDLGIFIVDIKDVKLDINNLVDGRGTIYLNNNNIEKVEYSQFSNEPSIARIVVYVKEEIKNKIVSGDNGKGLIITFGDDIPEDNTGGEIVESKNKISSITKEFINGRDALVIEGANKDSVNIMKLKNPERIVIDVVDAILEGSTYYTFDYNFDFIKGVRVSQFLVDENYKSTDKVVRVVLDIKDEIIDPEIKIDGESNKIIIYPQKSVWENIEYTSDGKYRNLTLKKLYNNEYNINYIPDSKIMVLSIPKGNIDLNEGTISVKDGLIDEIEIMNDGQWTNLIIKYMRNIQYDTLFNEWEGTFTLTMERGDVLSPSDRIIVIDPGHGGTQPGTTSVTGVKEKDFNLAVSLQLEKKLKALGYNVIMTRNTDTTLGLYERADIANNVNADLFVSIHGNAHDNKSIAGIQVLYCPANQSAKKDIDQFPFAKSIMDELLKGTGAADKGIVQRPNIVVLRETKMPAVLVEAGFLSNAEEEKKLLTPEYQSKIVDSLIKGIEKYLDMY